MDESLLNGIKTGPPAQVQNKVKKKDSKENRVFDFSDVLSHGHIGINDGSTFISYCNINDCCMLQRM